MGKLIRTTDAADKLGVHRQTIENWAAKGVLQIKEIGRAHYVDAELIDQIAEFGSDAIASAKALEAVKIEYDEQSEEIRQQMYEMRESWRLKNDDRRYRNLCVEASIRSDFFVSVLDMLVISGDLTQRESAILAKRLMGTTLEEIGYEFGLQRERIRQIVEKAIRKSHELTEFKAKVDEMSDLRNTIAAQKAVIVDLRSRLKLQEEDERLAKAKDDEERRRIIMENDELCKKLNTKLIYCGLSVRALNCLRSVDVETVGDLIKCRKTDLLKCRNFGKKSMIELDEFVESMGFSFGTDVDSIYNERIAIQMAETLGD